MNRIVVLGRVVLDQRFWVEQFPPTGNRTSVSDYREDIGGPAAVAALTIARLGGEPLLVGRRGSDSAGVRLEQKLQSCGIDTTEYRSLSGARTPVAAVLVTPQGERYLFPYHGKNLLEEEELKEALLPIDKLKEARAVLVDSRWPKGALRLVRAAREVGIPVVIDLDVNTPEMWEVASLATHVIADQELSEELGGADVLLKKLDGLNVWGAVTRGERGTIYHGGHTSSFEVSVRDSTGAGDVFHGAFTLGITENMTEERALVFASAAAALRCTMADVPNREQVDRFLKESGE